MNDLERYGCPRSQVPNPRAIPEWMVEKCGTCKHLKPVYVFGTYDTETGVSVCTACDSLDDLFLRSAMDAACEDWSEK